MITVSFDLYWMTFEVRYRVGGPILAVRRPGHWNCYATNGHLDLSWLNDAWLEKKLISKISKIVSHKIR